MIKNLIILNINSISIWIGNPKPCLLRCSEPQALFFQKNDMPFLKKCVLVKNFVFCSILVNIRTYLPTGRPGRA